MEESPFFNFILRIFGVSVHSEVPGYPETLNARLIGGVFMEFLEFRGKLKQCLSGLKGKSPEELMAMRNAL
jgi:hypothetical protein